MLELGRDPCPRAPPGRDPGHLPRRPARSRSHRPATRRAHRSRRVPRRPRPTRLPRSGRRLRSLRDGWGRRSRALPRRPARNRSAPLVREFVQRGLRAADGNVRHHRDPAADRERARRGRSGRTSPLDLKEREIRLAGPLPENGQAFHPPPRSTRTRPPGIATLADVMMRSREVASAVPIRRFFFPEREATSEGGYATTVRMLDSTESTTPRSEASSERKERAASRRRCSRSDGRGHRAEETTQRPRTAARMKERRRRPSPEDDVHVARRADPRRK